MIKVAMLSRWHVHANDYAREALANPDIEIAVVWDEEPERGRQWASELGVPFEENLSAVLSNPDIDGVIIDTPTFMHKQVMLEAAKHKKHIFSEKVLAFTTNDCDEIFSAVDENGVHLMLSLKRLNDDYYLYAEKAVKEGLLGRINSVRCRLAHGMGLPLEGKPYGKLPPYFFDPKVCGGGALMDLGAHPIYLTNRLAGKPKGVYARLESTLGHEVDDNSAVLVDYSSGVLGIIEAGFSSNDSFRLELHGTDGQIIIEKGGLKIKSIHVNDGQWFTPSELPAKLPSAMEQWVKQIQVASEPSITREDMWRLTQINEAALVSHAEGRRVELASYGGRV
ncbi:Gfo/Idh/MocA family protein [Neobacillus niacini]|uniref:Gfo/Idh/MocA family protein n=1 Tax=Neobacillus niacini TaxID=86668 RepID=UPI001C8E560E|nr:Gfo/Idh/MocA family oxidoreductase [Neobacillus niacini]MBY0145032.1 Gfo/Idh/MocA family oxidoreductase [Neobacillus niacini]